MPNADSAFGLRPIRNGLGAPWNMNMAQPYCALSSYGTALYIGDPVLVTGDLNSSAIDQYPAGTLQVVNKTSAGGGAYTSGVIVGFGPYRDNLTYQYNPASTNRIIYVCDDPDAVFLIQEDGDTTPLAATSGGNNADYIFGTGSTVTGKSAVELDSDTVNTTNTLQMRILRLHPTEDNAIGAWANWEVKINLHTFRYTTGIA